MCKQSHREDNAYSGLLYTKTKSVSIIKAFSLMITFSNQPCFMSLKSAICVELLFETNLQPTRLAPRGSGVSVHVLLETGMPYSYCVA